ncbi:hypothetical protein N9S30_00610, partial [bacterium]|nr:hypothetical protein [bacterium]
SGWRYAYRSLSKPYHVMHFSLLTHSLCGLPEQAAHKSLTTNVIFAHLAAKAVPVFGADGSKKAINDSLRLENKRSRPKESQVTKKLNKILKKRVH